MVNLDLSGLLGIWLMVVIAGSFALICLTTSIFLLFYRRYGAMSSIKRGASRLMFSTLAVLIIDILFIYLFVSDYGGGEPYLKGETLDQFATYVWLPIHAIGISLLIFFTWFFDRNKRIKKAE